MGDEKKAFGTRPSIHLPSVFSPYFNWSCNANKTTKMIYGDQALKTVVDIHDFLKLAQVSRAHY